MLLGVAFLFWLSVRATGGLSRLVLALQVLLWECFRTSRTLGFAADSDIVNRSLSWEYHETTPKYVLHLVCLCFYWHTRRTRRPRTYRGLYSLHVHTYTPTHMYKYTYIYPHASVTSLNIVKCFVRPAESSISQSECKNNAPNRYIRKRHPWDPW